MDNIAPYAHICDIYKGGHLGTLDGIAYRLDGRTHRHDTECGNVFKDSPGHGEPAY